ncbi:MAG: RNase adapter RapZ [Christensenellales bacterium]|jgi:UPF0042 nucleotide-binding protein
MRLVIVTGMSGAGKSQVIRTMEDIGYYCVDNLPPMLIPTFVELFTQRSGSGSGNGNIAVGVDIRGGEFFDSIYEALLKIKDMAKYEILFMDASDAVLIKRFKETRRSHPLLAGMGSLRESINRERDLLQRLRESAHHVIDTTSLSTRELRKKLMELFLEGAAEDRFPITIVSFGYKWGMPADADMVLDVRFINNPFYIDRLREHSGRDEDVIAYVMGMEETRTFLSLTTRMLEFLIPQFIKEGKGQLVVALGCTGGMHRSVVIADAVGERVARMGYRVTVDHRDLERERSL